MAYKDKNDPRGKESRMKWYWKNKDRQIQNQIARKKELRIWFNKYKETLKCNICDMSFEDIPECCDFHHTDPSNKEGTVTSMVDMGKKKLMKEVSKCIPLCANCHRTHHKQLKHQRNVEVT